MSDLHEKNISLEAFNLLDFHYNGLLPEVQLKDKESEGVGNDFVWVCNYGGMRFFRALTLGELYTNAVNRYSSLN